MRRPRGEDGAYAILYGLLLVVILGTAAVVVDLAAMREDRRQSRLATDSAAVAGARALDPLGTLDPVAACTEAWSYVSTNMDVPVPAVTNCTAFPPAPVTACPTTATTALAESEGVRVVVTWPVLQDSPLLTEPAVEGADDDVSGQEVDEDVDGTSEDRCQRIAVSVRQVHEPLLAGLFGVGDTTTDATSVARATTVPGSPEAIAALNVLNRTDCQTVLTSGQGSILVNAVGDRPGIIAVESSGTSGCGMNRYVIDPADNSAGAFVRADGPAGEGRGFIYSYALTPAPDGRPEHAFDPALVPPSGTLLRPRPTLLTKQTGDAPVRDIYDCTGRCDAYPKSFVATLRARLRSGTPAPYEHHESPYNALAFTRLSGGSCTVGSGSVVLLPAGNYWFDCAGDVDVRGRLIVAGGTVVTRRGINVGAQGCFAMNVPVVAAPPSCAGLVVGGDTVPPASKGAIVYLRDGDFTKGGQGGIVMPRTFVHVDANRGINFGAGDGALFWTNPRQSDPTCGDECAASRFSKVSLWTESTATQELGGQTALTMRGVLFTPKATFRYSGQPSQNQTNAQFWADKLVVGGQSGLTMAPDPTDAVASPSLGVVLIR